MLSLEPDSLAHLLSLVDPAPLQALRCTCRLFRAHITEKARDQCIARAVAHYTRATRAGNRIRVCSRYGQHVADFCPGGHSSTVLLLNGVEFAGHMAERDRVMLMGDLRVWISSVDFAPKEKTMKMLVHVGVSTREFLFTHV